MAFIIITENYILKFKNPILELKEQMRMITKRENIFCTDKNMFVKVIPEKKYCKVLQIKTFVH